MNVSTILIKPEEALAKLESYKRLTGKRRLAEDDKLQSLYQAVSNGARVLNLTAAFQETGLNELKQPRLAIARADWAEVRCVKWSMPGPNWGLRFGLDPWRARTTDIRVPLDQPYGEFFPSGSGLRSPVPHVPPDARPKFKLHNYHILFEVKDWETYPVDPFLLRRVQGMLFVVEAEWELTDLEASLLSSMNSGN